MATIICSLCVIAATTIGIAEQYIKYTMFGFMGVFWERAVWIHGATFLSLAMSLVGLKSALGPIKSFEYMLYDNIKSIGSKILRI